MGFMNFLKHTYHPSGESSEGGAETQVSSTETQASNTEAQVPNTESAPQLHFDDETARLAQAAAEQERQIRQNCDRQENKLIWLFTTNNERILGQNPPAASDEQRQQVYQQINDGVIAPAVESRALQCITPPYGRPGKENYGPIIARIGDKHGLKILAYTAGADIASVNRIRDDETINSYYEQMLQSLVRACPTPVEFAEREKTMLDDLKRAGNPPSKIAEYENDFERFKHSVYGKRYEYHQAYQQLEAKANHHSHAQSERTKVLDAIHGANQYGNLQPTPNERDDTEVMPKPSVEVSFIMEPESEEILRTGQIDGDPYILDGKAYQLTPGHLKAAGLEPKYKFELDDKTSIAVSKVYHAERRDAIMAYVRTDKGTKIVSYYRSNSQGTWRYLPDYVGEDQEHQTTGMAWFGKGYSEESLNLPAATQEALEIVSKQPHAEDIGFSTSFLLAGTAKRYDSKEQYRQALHANSMRGGYYTEVSSHPSLDLGHLSYDKTPPERLELSGAIAPDFNQPGSSFNLQSSIYGEATSEHYPSADGKLLWTFNRDQSGRAWIGGVEVQSPVSSVGLRTEWGQIGDYGTPLYEYKVQDGSYGDRLDQRKGYVSMWQNYLSKAPIIRQYLAHKRQHH